MIGLRNTGFYALLFYVLTAMVTVSPLTCHTRRPRCLLNVALDVREVDGDRPSAVPTGCARQRPGVHDAHHPRRGRPHR